MIYLDNNATTLMPDPVIRELVAWCNHGNASADYHLAKRSKEMIKTLRFAIAKWCGVKTDDCPSGHLGHTIEDDGDHRDPHEGNPFSHADTLRSVVRGGDTESKMPPKDMYSVIFNSGASEGNGWVIRSTIDAWREAKGTLPHIIISTVEHKSILECVQDLANRGLCTASAINPATDGRINPDDVASAINEDTALISIMHANNETGAINDIAAIGRIAKTAGIPFHCDIVQSFGKYSIKLDATNIDAATMSFHKLGGITGVGAVIIRERFILSYGLKPLTYGTQNCGIRGGTYNVPSFGACLAALRLNCTNRVEKNTKIASMRILMMKDITLAVPTRSYSDYYAEMIQYEPQYASQHAPPDFEIVFISGINSAKGLRYLDNTLLLSVVNRKIKVCNAKMKKSLEERGIVVSIGSACNTASKYASHVLDAIGADQLIKRGTLRISIGDINTLGEIKAFVKEFLIVAKLGR